METLTLKKPEEIKDNEIDESRLFDIGKGRLREADEYYQVNQVRIESRAGGEFMGHAFFLSDEQDWKLGRDRADQIVLIPLKKKK